MKIWTLTKLTGLVVIVVVVVLLAASFNLNAQSQPLPVKPGLWEMQATTTNVMALPPEAEARIAAMPPAQQAQVRAMMGGGMGGGKPVSATRQVCLAPQTSMDSLLDPSRQSPGMQCTYTNKVQTASNASFDLSCTGATGSGKGHAEYHAIDDTHMSSTIHMTITASAQGHTSNSTVDVSTTGKFLNADCGDVRPVGGPPAAH
jgi:Protein of unknown function (DUF3617)